jgi:hypothetical protein
VASVTAIRRASGKPWAEIIGGIQSSREFLEEVGKILVESVIREARKDLAKQGNKPTPRGVAEGIPASEKFFKSFSFHVTGANSVEISSDWEWIDQILEGRGPYKMTWMRQVSMPNVKGVAPLHSKTRTRPASGPARRPPGKVVYRATPGKWKRNWIHPGFAKHNFVDRAFRKAKLNVDEAMRKRLGKALGASSNFG